MEPAPCRMIIKRKNKIATWPEQESQARGPECMGGKTMEKAKVYFTDFHTVAFGDWPARQIKKTDSCSGNRPD